MNGKVEADDFYVEKKTGKLHKEKRISKTTAYRKAERSGLQSA